MCGMLNRLQLKLSYLVLSMKDALQSTETDQLALQVAREQTLVQKLKLQETKRSHKEAKEKEAAEKKGSPVNKSQWSHHTSWGQQGSWYKSDGSGSCQKTRCPHPSRSYHPKTWQISQSSDSSCRSWVRDEVAASLKRDGLHFLANRARMGRSSYPTMDGSC